MTLITWIPFDAVIVAVAPVLLPLVRLHRLVFTQITGKYLSAVVVLHVVLEMALPGGLVRTLVAH